MVIKRVCLTKCGIYHPSFWRTYIICNFLHIGAGKLFSCYFCRNLAEIEGLHLKAVKIIERLPKNIMDCGILQRAHLQNLGWFYNIQIQTWLKAKLWLIILVNKKILNRVTLNGKGNENGIKISRSNQQKTNCTCSTLFS